MSNKQVEQTIQLNAQKTYIINDARRQCEKNYMIHNSESVFVKT